MFATSDESTSLPILLFRMGNVRTAFILDAVVQVFDAVDVGDFPGHLPENVIGLINVRGQKLVLADIRARWGMPAGKVQLNNQIVVIECAGKSISIIVDEVIGTRNVPLKKIVRLEDILGDGNPHMAAPDLEGILILLDPDHLFDRAQLDELAAWAESM